MVDNCHNCGNKGVPYRKINDNWVYCEYLMGKMNAMGANRRKRDCWVPEE